MAQIGIEASNDEQRDELNKQLRTETVEEAVWIELPTNYAHHDMAHILMPTEHMNPQQIWSYIRWAWTSVYLHPIRLVRNLLSRNEWRRQNWWGMLVYIGKQMARNLVPRFR